jgi:hypothetical protein
MKLLVEWVLASAASDLSLMFWDTLAPFHIEVSLLPHTELAPPLQLFGITDPFCVPLSLTVYTFEALISFNIPMINSIILSLSLTKSDEQKFIWVVPVSFLAVT